MPIELKTVIEAIEMTSDSFDYYYDKSEGKTVVIAEELIAGESNEELAEMIAFESDRFIPFPNKSDIHEYGIIEDFIIQFFNGEVQENLLNSIQCKGAFRRFKDTVIRLGIKQIWYNYRDEEYRKIAVDWCKDNNLDYAE